jgi:hypothetical protein
MTRYVVDSQIRSPTAGGIVVRIPALASPGPLIEIRSYRYPPSTGVLVQKLQRTPVNVFEPVT